MIATDVKCVHCEHNYDHEIMEWDIEGPIPVPTEYGVYWFCECDGDDIRYQAHEIQDQRHTMYLWCLKNPRAVLDESYPEYTIEWEKFESAIKEHYRQFQPLIT